MNDLDALRNAIQAAKDTEDRPSIIKVFYEHHHPYSFQVRTVIGEGSLAAGKHSVHGAPLGAADIVQLKTKYGFNPEEVMIDSFQAYFRSFLLFTMMSELFTPAVMVLADMLLGNHFSNHILRPIPS